ncbi:hypothetical protein TWF569_004783 [Orbilia oligospora]|nr:hypothetical protein TWF569_004783 [Orbilia oligospora]
MVVPDTLSRMRTTVKEKSIEEVELDKEREEELAEPSYVGTDVPVPAEQDDPQDPDSDSDELAALQDPTLKEELAALLREAVTVNPTYDLDRDNYFFGLLTDFNNNFKTNLLNSYKEFSEVVELLKNDYYSYKDYNNHYKNPDSFFSMDNNSYLYFNDRSRHTKHLFIPNVN